MRERFPGAYEPFVLPFTIAMVFILLYLSIGIIRMVLLLNQSERRLLVKSIFSRKIFTTIKDIVNDCLLHIKIFKRNLLLGYMHASIAFGWFMLILIAHIEVAVYTPHRGARLYYPIFFRYFVMETEETIKGAFFFFLMDFFLLIVLSGVGLAIYKRFKSIALGMRRTTKLKLGDTLALYSLWMIFPSRLIAESFTAGISGGSFLTKSINNLFSGFVNYKEYLDLSWWIYSCFLAIFLVALPFSRYMHIPTEMFLILLRNAGIRSKSSRKGYAEAEIYSCSSCGICIDACPMTVSAKNVPYSSVYFMRALRGRSPQTEKLTDQCLMCGKCVELCPVSVDSCRLKLLKRKENFSPDLLEYKYLNAPSSTIVAVPETNFDVLYYAGCMTQLTPKIYISLFKVLEAGGIKYKFMDKDGGVCCGRPLMLMGGLEKAKELILRNTEEIIASGAKTLLVSCPICYKVFKEEYQLEGIEVVHHTVYIQRLISQGRIQVTKGENSFVYHDPCDLGRGSGIYEQPRDILHSLGILKASPEERGESICCGGALGSRSMSFEDRTEITQNSLSCLMKENPDKIITACPLCLKTFSPQSKVEVLDIAEITLRLIRK